MTFLLCRRPEMETLMTKYRIIDCIIVLSAFTLSVTAQVRAASYAITDLGTLGGTESFGSSHSASGQVAGASYTTGDAAYHAYLWKPTTPNGASGTMTDLQTLGGTDSFGNGLNASGQVTGESFTTGDAATHAFLWKPTTPGGASGTMHDLLTLGGTNSYGYGISAAGQVTGASDRNGDARTHAFLWKPTTPNGTSGTMHNLGSLGGTESHGSAINASGQVAGSSLTTGDAAYHAFLWKPMAPNGTSGAMHDLLTLGGAESFGSAVNASGQVAGFSSTTGDAAYHAYLWTPTTPNGASGTMLDLATLGGLNSYSYNVGAGGQVVGASEVGITSDHTHAFLYTSASGMVDLNALIDPLSGWELSDAADINEAGQITGQGLINGEYHAYLLTPVPAILADFNGDSMVDAADLASWKTGFGTNSSATRMQGDADGDQDVDGADFLSWQRQLGSAPAVSSATAAATAVPEPATMALLVATALSKCSRRRGPAS
jgi:probable HAF family extracellular repeat protein